MRTKDHKIQPVSAGSMADIAFLLLIFFLVSTTINQEKGLMLQLPPVPEHQTTAEVHERNLFKIGINSDNQFLIEDQVRVSLVGLKDDIKSFVNNNGVKPDLSDTPEKAVVSIKANRGTDYKYFIQVLDQVKQAYYEIYGGNVGLTAEEYRNLDHSNPEQYAMYKRGREGIPMNISVAEPDKEAL